eukprot:1146809-Pelagomonas_calceolata.AAC.1
MTHKCTSGGNTNLGILQPGPTLICASQNNDCRWSQKEQRVVGRVTRVTIQELQWGLTFSQ